MIGGRLLAWLISAMSGLSAASASVAQSAPCAPARAVEVPADSSSDLRAFRMILDDFNRAWATRDAALFVRHFAPDGDFMQAFGRYRADRASTETFMTMFFGAQTDGFQARELGTRVRMLTPDAAFVEQELEGDGVTNTDGSKQPPRRGNMMLALVRRDGRWLIASYRYLDIHPAMLRR
jgi:uncharacterized protein (TIGR02246 family)